jgi:hypothetical protein
MSSSRIAETRKYVYKKKATGSLSIQEYYEACRYPRRLGEDSLKEFLFKMAGEAENGNCACLSEVQKQGTQMRSLYATDARVKEPQLRISAWSPRLWESSSRKNTSIPEERRSKSCRKSQNLFGPRCQDPGVPHPTIAQAEVESRL